MAGADDQPVTSLQFLRRVGLLIAVMAIFSFSLDVYWKADLPAHPEVVVTLLVLWSGAITIAVYVLTESPTLRITEHVAVVLLLASGVVNALSIIYIVSPAHLGSDVTLFTRYAALHVLDGVNPYTVSFDGAHALFNHNDYVATPKQNGSYVTTFSYPALSFLFYVPVVWAGLDVRLLGSVLFFPLAVLIIYAVAPQNWGVLPILPLYANLTFFNAVVIDFELLWVVPLMLAVLFWYRDSDLSAVWYGIACAVKQNPWLIAPFIFIRFLHEGDTYREGFDAGLRYGGIAGLIFAVPNLYFVVDAPGAWVDGVLTPILGGGTPLVFYGQGLAILPTTGVFPVTQSAYTLLLLGALAFALLSYILFFEDVKDTLWLVPMVVMFFNYRGSQKYYTMFIPVAIIVLITMYQKQRGQVGTITDA